MRSHLTNDTDTILTVKSKAWGSQFCHFLWDIPPTRLLSVEEILFDQQTFHEQSSNSVVRSLPKQRNWEESIIYYYLMSFREGLKFFLKKIMENSIKVFWNFQLWKYNFFKKVLKKWSILEINYFILFHF